MCLTPPAGLLRVLATLLIAASGCALWESEEAVDTAGKSPLKQLTPKLDAIELEVSFVERPIGDPLLGEALWDELHQVSTLDPALLTSLRRNGFRFGVAGSDPPRNLLAAMDVAGGRYNGHRYSQPSGQELTIEAWPIYPSCRMNLNEGGEAQTKQYELARCVFRVIPERMQDGWVRLEFIPEIHHGKMQLRPVPGDQNWQQRPSQLVDPLYDQRFSVELAVGELVVISAQGDNAASVGHHFFRGGTTDSDLQRLLIVRLAKMKRLDPVYE